MSVGGGELPLDIEVPHGARVEVVASTRDLARRALRVFGCPLGAVAAAAFVAEWVGANEALIVAALFGAVCAMVAVRGAKTMPDGLATRTSRCAGTSDEGLRVVLRG